MRLVTCDPRLADLATLDIVDLGEDGGFRVNGEFLASCRRAFRRDPSRFGEIVQDHILARAVARGLVGRIDDLEALALAVLELASDEAEAGF